MSSVVLSGDTSGTITLAAPSIAGSNVVSIPAATGTMALTTGQIGMKNRIINGAMLVNQRASSVTATTSWQYTVDRFAVYGSVASKFTAAQSSTAPAGFINSLLLTSSSAYSVGATDEFLLKQSIEGYNIADLGWGTADAKTVTLSFWVRSSLTGTFSGNIRNSANNRCYVFSYTISSANTWEQKSITITGDTTGTWLTDNGVGMQLWWTVGTGSTYLGSAGSWGSTPYDGVTGTTSLVGTNGATFYITGVQLEVGTTATSFDFRAYGTELALCQRYYNTGRVIARTSMYNVAQNGFDSIEATAFYKVSMRATPTIGTTNNTSGTITVPTTTSEMTSINKLGVFGTNLDVSYTASAEL